MIFQRHASGLLTSLVPLKGRESPSIVSLYVEPYIIPQLSSYGSYSSRLGGLFQLLSLPSMKRQRSLIICNSVLDGVSMQVTVLLARDQTRLVFAGP